MRRVWVALVVAAALLIAIPGNAAASTYTNPNPVAIPEEGVAMPYPSTITVEGVSGSVVEASATLHGISHTFPNDIAVLLVAPGGQRTLLMSFVCGITPMTGQTLTFDDAAGAFLPLIDPCPSGIYHPTRNPNGVAEFPAPAPPGDQTTAAMTALNGSSANGNWQLFIRDYGGGDSGSIAGGWSIDLLTDATCSGKAATLTGTAGDDDLTGTEGDDVILSFGGKDTIRGMGGKDTICGGQKKDVLRGGSGKDKLLGQGGKDKLSGGGGKDVCKGGKKDDTAKKCEVEKSI